MREIHYKLDHFSVLFEQAEWILGKEYSWIHDGWRHFKNYETIFRLLSPDESESESCDRFAFFFFDFLSFFSFLDFTLRSGVSSRVLNWGIHKKSDEYFLIYLWRSYETTLLCLSLSESFRFFFFVSFDLNLFLRQRLKHMKSYFLNFGLIW